MTFPYRGKPDRSLSDLALYDNMAPHITGTATQKFPAMYIREGPPMPAPLVEDGQPLNTSLVRRSQRQFDYSHSGGVPITEIRDADSFFIHCFGPDPESMEEAKLMHDANDWIAAELAESSTKQNLSSGSPIECSSGQENIQFQNSVETKNQPS